MHNKYEYNILVTSECVHGIAQFVNYFFNLYSVEVRNSEPRNPAKERMFSLRRLFAEERKLYSKFFYSNQNGFHLKVHNYLLFFWYYRRFRKEAESTEAKQSAREWQEEALEYNIYYMYKTKSAWIVSKLCLFTFKRVCFASQIITNNALAEKNQELTATVNK